MKDALRFVGVEVLAGQGLHVRAGEGVGVCGGEAGEALWLCSRSAAAFVCRFEASVGDQWALECLREMALAQLLWT